MALITIWLPGLKVESEANIREHWGAKYRRHVKQQVAVIQALGRHGLYHGKPTRVTLVRVGKRRLDTDNLANGFKAIRDAIARHLGFNDGDPSCVWEYKQEPGEYSARMEIEL